SNSLLSPPVFEFSLLDVFQLKILHHIAAVREEDFQAARHSLGNFNKLIVNHRADGNRPARWNHMSAPLEDESKIPQGQQPEQEAFRRERNPESAEQRSEFLQHKPQPNDKYGSQRN